MKHYGQAITPIDHNPYVGVDAGGRLHVHVNGVDYMDNELAEAMENMTSVIDAARAAVNDDETSMPRYIEDDIFNALETLSHDR